MQVIRIEALGGFGLFVDGENRSATVPRKLAAILAVLALSAGRGVARDRLLTLLWADVDPERARHALAQSLYAIRRLVGHEDVVVGNSHLMLNLEKVTTDVIELERAAEEGDDVALLAVYRGPVLDGFSVGGLGELDRWLDEQRAECARRVGTVLDAASRRYLEAGQPDRAVSALKRRVALDPLDASATLSLMRALAAAGDVPGAVQQGRVYGALVRQELDLDPDGRVGELADELQRTPPRTPRRDDAAVRAEAPHTSTWWTLLRQSIAAQLQAVRRGPSREMRLMARRAAVTAVATMAAMLAVARLGDQRARHGTPVAGTAVLPFRGTGLSRDLVHLPTAVVEMLSAAIADRDTLPVLDPVFVHRWWGERQEALQLAPPETLAATAQALGAGWVVTGTLVGDARLLVMRATLVNRTTGVVRSSATASGPLDSLPAMVAEVATRLVGPGRLLPAMDYVQPIPGRSPGVWR